MITKQNGASVKLGKDLRYPKACPKLDLEFRINRDGADRGYRKNPDESASTAPSGLLFDNNVFINSIL